MHSRAIQFLFDPQPVAMMCGVKEGPYVVASKACN